MAHKNLILLGTSHISGQSIKEVNRLVNEEKPGIVCLELDRGRLNGLLSGQKTELGIRDILKVGIKGYVLIKLGAYVQEKFGKMVGSKPGEEMKTAFLLAQEKGLKVALIDQDIRITLKKLTKAITWKEKFRFFWDLVMGMFGRGKVIFDISTVPTQDVIDALILQVKERYPGVYRVLIDERNQYMARKLKAIMNNYPEEKVLAVVGAGHMKEILKILNEE